MTSFTQDRRDPRPSTALLLAVFALSALTGATGGQADDWPMQRHDMYGTGVSKETLPAEMTQIWEYRTAQAAEPIAKRLTRPKLPYEHDEFLPRIIAAGGKVFAGLADHRVVGAVRARGGDSDTDADLKRECRERDWLRNLVHDAPRQPLGCVAAEGMVQKDAELVTGYAAHQIGFPNA